MGGLGREGGLTVLVTGVGGPPGVSIFKACRQSGLRPRLVAIDADPVSVGLFRADAAYVVPRISTDERAYLARLEAICEREAVAMVCFGSEEELRRVAPHAPELERRTRARLIVNAPRSLDAFMDKWATFMALRDAGLPVPDTVLAHDAEGVRAFLARHAFPAILKPRRGSGSRSVFLVHDAAELALRAAQVPEAVLQEQLLPDDEEYTVGLYKSPRIGYVGQIAFRRTLAAGLTYKAEVVRDPEIEAVCRRVVEAFDVWGPVNVQLRKTAAGVRIFEINPRFSSSAVMRAYFGFNEPELCLRDLVLEEQLAAPAIRPGWSLRYWGELYVTDAECEQVRRAGEAAVAGPTGETVDDF
jgi:carbamoyl-phosphate synthase large subunit